jgi:hypothetical protein
MAGYHEHSYEISGSMKGGREISCPAVPRSGSVAPHESALSCKREAASFRPEATSSVIPKAHLHISLHAPQPAYGLEPRSFGYVITKFSSLRNNAAAAMKS